MTKEQKDIALRELALAVNNELVTDEECTALLRQMGATEDELEKVL